jgi:hypothetical protein
MKLNEFHIENDAAIGMKAEQMHADHEVQMARADCYKAAKAAIDLHNLLKTIPDTSNLEGWVQAKITKAADYLDSVRNYLEYERISGNELTVAEDGGTSSGSVASSMGGGNGFLNGGPGSPVQRRIKKKEQK